MSGLKRGAATVVLVAGLAGCAGSPSVPPRASPAPRSPAAAPLRVTSGALRPGRIPASLSSTDVYAGDRPGRLARAVRGDPARVYVPNSASDSVDVVSQRTGRILGHFAVGALPQHVTPSWDLRTL